jgi:hypothetical protein
MRGKAAIHWLPRQLRRLGRGEAGSFTVEFVIVIPLIFWCFIMMFTFFQGYRTQAVNLRAAYLIGDQLSRDGQTVTPAMINGMGNLFNFLVQSGDGARLRVTAFDYDDEDDTYRVIWSAGVGEAARVQGEAINDVRDRLPEMAENDYHLLTETWLNFNTNDFFDFVGIGDITFYEAVVNRFRSARLCWNPNESDPPETRVCD